MKLHTLTRICDAHHNKIIITVRGMVFKEKLSDSVGNVRDVDIYETNSCTRFVLYALGLLLVIQKTLIRAINILPVKFMMQKFLSHLTQKFRFIET